MFHVTLILVLLIGVVVALISERLRADLLALVMMVALMLCGVISPEDAYAGFSKEVIILLAATFVVSGALRETGAVDVINRRLLRHAPNTYVPTAILFMAVVSGVSAFVSNTTVTAMFIPTAEGLGRRFGMRSPLLYLALAYAAILGGTVSLIGTSTNLAVSGYLSKTLQQPIGFFEAAPVGLVLVAVGICYILVIRKFVRRNRDENGTAVDSRSYHTQVSLGRTCSVVGQRASASSFSELEVRVSRVIRSGSVLDLNCVDHFAAGDTVIMEATADALLKLESMRGLQIGAELKAASPVKNDHRAEVLVAPHSRLLGRSLLEANFEQRARVSLLGLFREGQEVLGTLGEIVFEVGDFLLVEGLPQQLSLLGKDWGLSVMGEVDHAVYDSRKALVSASLFVAAIVTSAFRLLPPSVAFLSAAVGCVLSGCLRISRAYETIVWKLLVLIACMSSFATAMEKTGGAKLLSKGVVAAFEPLGAVGILTGLTIVTILLAPVLSSAAAALLVLPVAINAAQTVGANARPFEIAVMLAPSISFFLPLEPSFLLIFGPGKFRNADFVRTGLGATILLTVALIVMVSRLWPLYDR